MNHSLRLRLLLLASALFASVACKKDSPSPAPVAPAITIMASVNGAPAVALTNAKVEQNGFASPSPLFYVYGELPNGRTLRVRYFYASSSSAKPNTAPLAEVTLFTIASGVSENGTALAGSTTNSPATATAQGTFSASFSGGTTISGGFKDVSTK